MVTCLLCLQKKSNQIKINSKKGKELNCSNIIAQHFWFKSEIEKNSKESVCLSCWDVVFAFHQLYKTVAEAHNFFECEVANNSVLLEEEIKIELDSLELPPKIEVNQIENEDEKIKAEETLNFEPTVLDSNFSDEDDSDNEIPLSKLKLKKAQKTETIPNNDAALDSEPESFTTEQMETQAFECDVQYLSENESYNVCSDMDDEQGPTGDSLPETNSTCTELSKKLDENIAKFFEKLDCRKCKTSFEKFGDLEQHTKRVHNRPPNVICCNRKYGKRQTLSNHVLIHLNPQHLKCSYCKRVFEESFQLEKHIESDHQCSQCLQAFPAKLALHEHLLKIHSIKADCEFFCAECDKKFSTKRKLRDHRRLAHSVKAEAICDQCGKRLGSRNALQRHIQDKHTEQPVVETPDPVQCNICGKWLKHRHTLRQHQIWQHEKRFAQQCPLCDHKATTRRALDNHIHRMHNSKREFPCTMCDKVLKSERELKGHINIHTKEVQHPCEVCFKTFNIRGSLLRHMKRYHSGGKPPKQRIQCEICGFWAISPLFLQKHIKKVHEKKEAVKQPCPICGRVSVNEKALKRHIRRNHGPKETTKTEHEEIDIALC